MLTNEQAALITVLSDHIHGKATELNADVDRRELIALALSQKVAGIIYDQTHLPEFAELYSNTVYNYAQQKRAITEIEKAFRDASIPYLIVKGYKIGNFYPKPQLRQSGDVDILTHEDDRIRAAEAVEKIGFHYNYDASGKRTEYHEWAYYKGNLELELHKRLLYNDLTNDPAQIAYTDRVWEFAQSEDGISYRVPTEFQFIYMISHLLKHFLYAGVNIRMFLDIAVMMKNAEMDWDYIEKTLDEINLMKFAKRCFATVGHWFAVPCPMECDADDGFFDETAKRIFEKHEESPTRMNAKLNRMRNEKVSSKNVVAPVLAMIFPNYGKLVQKYPKLTKFGFFGRLLIPAMWIHRAIGSVFHRSTAAGIALSLEPVTLKKELQSREELLKKWGL